ncbi:hypothetical protein BD779DRAFT_1786716 [Infundibulicybe gibba]|nr:hypothetical protein BD779DRAFT_1786716 [Infundibulicybe gibba]
MSPSSKPDTAPTTRPSRISGLADELIIFIFQDQDLSADDLLSIAETCRRFHYIALEALFARYKVNLMSSRISLTSTNWSIKALPGLAISLSAVNRQIPSISCDLTTRYDSPSAMISETRALRRFFSKISAVSEVSLNLLNPLIPLWEECVIDLLDMIVLKGCTTLVVANFQTSSHRGDSQPRVQLPHSRRLPDRLKRILFPTHVARQLSLRACRIQVLPRFLQPYFAQLLNGSMITDLSFKYVYNGDEWASFIRYIEMPNLTHLTIFQCSLPHAALARFFKQHRTITYLDFQRNILPISPPALPAGLLPNLNTLRTMPEYLELDLPPLNTFRFLTTIFLPLGGGHSELPRAGVSRALESISQCTNDITLLLNIVLSTGLEAWLAAASPDDSVETSLMCVKALELDTTIRDGLSAGALALLPQWLALFPALDRVSVTAACLPASAERAPSAEALVRDIKMHCPRLSTVMPLSSYSFESGVPRLIINRKSTIQ